MSENHVSSITRRLFIVCSSSRKNHFYVADAEHYPEKALGILLLLESNTYKNRACSGGMADKIHCA
ncbi:MAG: hypothetical protein FGF53_08070, partial [Candidatus Brockarchaeota archaeon]|nr:hypothetical protein [Candidatus Brockarchaeota archaeon]